MVGSCEHLGGPPLDRHAVIGLHVQTLGLGVLGAEIFSEVSQSTVRGDGNPLAGMTEMDKLGIQASGSALETMSNIVDMGGSGNIGMQASLHDRPIGSDLVASMASMVEDAGGVFAARKTYFSHSH